MSSPERTDLDDLAEGARDARLAWVALTGAGGLVAIPDIVERWGVTRSTVRGYIANRDDFPRPVGTLGSVDFWLAADIDLWRATPRRRGRPPKTK